MGKAKEGSCHLAGADMGSQPCCCESKDSPPELVNAVAGLGAVSLAPNVPENRRERVATDARAVAEPASRWRVKLEREKGGLGLVIIYVHLIPGWDREELVGCPNSRRPVLSSIAADSCI